MSDIAKALRNAANYAIEHDIEDPHIVGGPDVIPTNLREIQGIPVVTSVLLPSGTIYVGSGDWYRSLVKQQHQWKGNDD